MLVLLSTARVPSVCCVRVLPAHSLAIGRATACVISCLETGLCPFEISALVTQPAQFALSAQITWLLLHLRGTQHVSNQTNTGFKLIQNPCAWYGVRHVRSHACRESACSSYSSSSRMQTNSQPSADTPFRAKAVGGPHSPPTLHPLALQHPQRPQLPSQHA